MPKDAALVASIVRRSFRRQAEELGISKADCPGYAGFETAERVRLRMSRSERVWIGLVADRAVGTVSCRPASKGRPPEILRLAVLPAFRGAGLGHVLMAAAETHLAAEGDRVVEIAIVARFEGLRLYYERLGYSATRRERFPALPFDVLFMEKRLQLSR